MIKVIEYENTVGEAMILLLDEENDKAISMPKSVYDEQQVNADKGTIS